MRIGSRDDICGFRWSQISSYSCIFNPRTRFDVFGRLIGLDGVILDGVAVTSFSKWGPVQFSIQWLELVKVSRILL